MKECPKCGRTDHLNDYVKMCEHCYNDPNRKRFYPTKDGFVMQEIPGNTICWAETVHGWADAKTICDALNAWQDRYNQSRRLV